mmetsp:Transcript_95167/g.174274  ORF Transcript_95167/g.174274 Transcript_95167/m.174274 type:complete len:124 (+) Transcript_95167:619-990(+)
MSSQWRIGQRGHNKSCFLKKFSKTTLPRSLRTSVTHATVVVSLCVKIVKVLESSPDFSSDFHLMTSWIEPHLQCEHVVLYRMDNIDFGAVDAIYANPPVFVTNVHVQDACINSCDIIVIRRLV